MNAKAMFSLTYGLFLLSTRLDGKDNACVINTAIQVASNPDRIAIAVNKGNYTNEILAKTDHFTLSVLSEEATFDLFQRFGFSSGRNTDKFAGFSDVKPLSNGTLAVTKGTNAYLSAHIEERHDLGSHTLFIAVLTDGDVLSAAPSASYAYYHAFIKPKPAEKKTEKTVWRCSVCGFEIEADELPDDYVCPICKHGKEVFEKVETQKNEEIKNINIKETTTMKKWVCPVCGYVHEGNEPPEVCPVCKVPGSKFTEMKADEKLAAEHEFGIYAKTVKNNPDITAEDKAYILEQLKANFTGECSEVGMYLCMARVAHREGYPEVGLYWEKAAYEEAEHAAKFAELLGSELEPNMKATTKDNLAWRVACEYGAVKGKFDLASCAKKNGLDAIHDTVHEMARDEARHGKALEGFLKRLFK